MQGFFMQYRFLLVLLFFTSRLFGQGASLTGIVLDASTAKPIQGVTVKLSNTAKSVATNKEGQFQLPSVPDNWELLFSAVGYKKQVFPMSVAQGKKVLIIRLEDEQQSLDEVVVNAPKKRKYTNKHNPTVDLIRKVIEKRDENNALNGTAGSYQEYEKLSMSLSIQNQKVDKSRLLKRFGFLKQGMDTLKYPGRSLVPIFMDEKIGQRKLDALKGNSFVLLGENQSRVDQYLDEDGIDEYLDKIYGETNIYDTDVSIGNRRFLSPIATLGPSFYKYYLVDTLKDTKPWHAKIRVEPRNREDALFSGFIYIRLDGSYALDQAELTINEATNINWVKGLNIVLNYSENQAHRFFLSRGVLTIDMGIFKDGMGLFGEKVTSRSASNETQLAVNGKALTRTGPQNPNGIDWNLARPEKLSRLEEQAFTNIDSLKQSKSFKNLMALGSFIMSGYYGRGVIEIGSVPSFYSFNPVEGSRFKFGGNTTDILSKTLVLDGYGAYGTKDRQWKYNMGATFSFNGESVYKFPVKLVSAKVSKEVQVPGQDLNFIDNDNFLLSFRRGENDKMFYLQRRQIEYWQEFENHLSFKVGFFNQILSPGGILEFDRRAFRRSNGNELWTSAFTGEIRWAPHEKLYQGKRYRRIINTGQPVFTLAAQVGVKGLLGGDYNYQRFILNANKRFFASQFGFADIVFESGIQFGKVPYPLMIIHRANQTYSYQLNSYNLMNSMEFMSDKYTSLLLQHSFNGFFLNKVPLLKKLDLREIASVKMLYGAVDASNRYTKSFDELPKDPREPQLFSLNNGAYIEGSVGLSNIFKILRVDLVRRFTYLNNPGVSPWGIRAKIGIDF
ncbi:DUF5686 and carboxypeptidase-like regulatory domain-containing protein [Sphingobacterium siyangense]|uniref:DUF5686 and carboxypeptidase-like regulatory domain-containing protein n=1 Tax=Sphingobacterium siyangense TaxID=459529 RepID=UPI002FDD70DB